MTSKSIFSICSVIAVGSLMLGGCAHSHLDRVPENYIKKEIPQTSVVDESPPAKLQVLVTRNAIYSSHSAIRLLYQGKVLMWDPSGSYGDLDEHKNFFAEHPLPDNYSKINALVMRGAPDLPSYFRFAMHTEDNSMEVFEWIVPETQAKLYRDIFIQGATVENNRYDFGTYHPFLLCSSYLTRFLQRFVGNTFKLNETYFFPDSLAHELFEHHPDTIYFFFKNRPVMVYHK